jgi:ABC-type polar amino acid transport system ATPase subunit
MIILNKVTSAALQTAVGKPIIADVSCTFAVGQINVLVGKSGEGKTTLLRLIAGLDAMNSGSITVNNVDVSTLSNQQRAEKIGFVFQEFNLFPHMTALENCVQPYMLAKNCSYVRAYAVVHNLFMQFGIVDLEKSYPQQLSGGQKQRVALVRTLCLNPELLLLDEPSSALDRENSILLVECLKKIRDCGVTVLVVSQDEAFIELLEGIVYEFKEGVVESI